LKENFDTGIYSLWHPGCVAIRLSADHLAALVQLNNCRFYCKQFSFIFPGTKACTQKFAHKQFLISVLMLHCAA